eukprot:1157454-Pelagomonas_calceolata.AAC.12
MLLSKTGGQKCITSEAMRCAMVCKEQTTSTGGLCVCADERVLLSRPGRGHTHANHVTFFSRKSKV